MIKMASISLFILLIVLAVLLIIGTPIAVAIIGSGLASALPSLNLEVTLITGAQRIFSGTSTYTLLAIPFFVLAGNIMNQGGIAKRLVNFVDAILGRVPGSLLLTNIGANSLFGAISGSAAAAAAVGSMLKDGEETSGYDMDLAVAANGASAPSGLLIPPSNALITYSLVAGGTSIAALFVAGYIPGLIWVLGCLIVAYIFAKKKGYTGTGDFSWKKLWKATLGAILPLSLIIIVIGGIVGGVFTATEGAAIAVVYSLFLALIIYRDINVKDLYSILLDSAVTSGIIVFIIGTSNILSWVMAFTGIPQMISATLLGVTENQFIILLIINIVLLISGTFMDVTPAILIFTPIFLPIVQQFGMSSIHFGIVLVYNLCIGNITPPVGNTLFVAIRVGDRKLSSVMRYMGAFYFAIFIGLMLVTYFPFFSMWLPEVAGLL